MFGRRFAKRAAWAYTCRIMETIEQLVARLPLQAAKEALVEIGAPAVDPLIDALQDKDDGVCMAAIEALASIGDARAIPAIIDVMHDSNLVLRQTNDVKEALAQFGGAAIQPLATALRDPDERICRLAILALTRIGAPAVEHLAVALSYRQGEMRRFIVWALGLIRDARAFDALVSVLKDPDPDTQCTAIEELGQIGSQRANPWSPQVGRAPVWT